MRSSIPSAIVVDGSSKETGCASSLASPVSAAATYGRCGKVVSGVSDERDSPSTRPEKRACISLISRSQAEVTTGASAIRRKSSAPASTSGSKLPTEKIDVLVPHQERVLLRRVQLDRELALGIAERLAGGGVYLRKAAEAQWILEVAGSAVAPERAAVEEVAEARDRRLEARIRTLAPHGRVDDAQIGGEGLQIERAGGVERIEQPSVVVDRERRDGRREGVVVDERDGLLRQPASGRRAARALARPSARCRPCRPSRTARRAEATRR